ncbi:hypothetical protein BH18ACI5_BH18ACI5_06790 [soil metagenome]
MASYSTMAAAHRSNADVGVAPSNASGGKYSGVPAMLVNALRLSSLRSFPASFPNSIGALIAARPKSSSLS